MSPLPQLLVLIAILVCAGSTNMVFVKSIRRATLRPIDGGSVLRDGKRLFGDNKTWQGFFGMIAATALWMAVAAWLVTHFANIQHLSLVSFEAFAPPLNAWLFGALLGLAYVVAELPNSFLKRRIGIPPGKNASGARGFFFLVLDQADSVIGCVIVLLFVSGITWLDALLLVLLGSIAHYLTNLGLYVVRLKRQAG